MKRYQVYLNPHSVSILDEVEKISNISRSKLVRGLVDRFTEQIAKVFAKRDDRPYKLTHLDKLVGAIYLKTKKSTNYALDDDEIYLRD